MNPLWTSHRFFTHPSNSHIVKDPSVAAILGSVASVGFQDLCSAFEQGTETAIKLANSQGHTSYLLCEIIDNEFRAFEPHLLELHKKDFANTMPPDFEYEEATRRDLVPGYSQDDTGSSLATRVNPSHRDSASALPYNHDPHGIEVVHQIPDDPTDHPPNEELPSYAEATGGY